MSEFWHTASARWYKHGGLLLTFTTGSYEGLSCIQFGFGRVTRTITEVNDLA